MNKKKLLHSKWTASKPENKEKHFLVISVRTRKADSQVIDFITLESVLTKKKKQIDPKELDNQDIWLEGWL